MAHLRRKIGTRAIQTRAGLGYVLMPNYVVIERRVQALTEQIKPVVATAQNTNIKPTPDLMNALRDLAIAASQIADILEEQSKGKE
jgi:hypothetical protein